jgi:uncharacterized protein (TIGR00251 family)
MGRIIRINVHTKAHDERVEEVDLDQYQVWITASPVDGAANEAVIEILADHFNVPSSAVRIKSGSKSRHKLIEID